MPERARLSVAKLAQLVLALFLRRDHPRPEISLSLAKQTKRKPSCQNVMFEALRAALAKRAGRSGLILTSSRNPLRTFVEDKWLHHHRLQE
jgi:hypothetical protein